MTLLFVCSGNTCRSPLAVAAWEAFAPAILREGPAGTRGFKVISAGLAAQKGALMSRHALTVAREWGIDLSDHRARPLVPEVARGASLICTMTADQAFVVPQHYGVEQGKVRLLGTFAEGGEEDALQLLLQEGTQAPSLWESAAILDPYGGSLEAYQACGAQIRRAVIGLARALRDGSIGKI